MTNLNDLFTPQTVELPSSEWGTVIRALEDLARDHRRRASRKNGTLTLQMSHTRAADAIDKMIAEIQNQRKVK